MPSTSLTPFCPRCGNKMRRESDRNGEYDWCINCGNYIDVLIGPPVTLKITSRVKIKKVRVRR